MSATEHPVRATFESHNPSNGEVVGRFPVMDAEDVRAAVARARDAAPWWSHLGFGGRRERLLRFKGVVARRADQLVDLISRETGKPHADAAIEVIIALDHLDWAARNAERIMRRRRIRSTALLANHAASVEYLPVGVVGVIGPWNYPLHTPLGSVTYALAAGNSVVFKPSEYTPAVAEWVCAAWRESVGEESVLQVVTGFGATGAALCRAGVDVLAFTGSAATGRKVMAACAERLTKVVMECGGNDAMIVLGDADVEAAADAALWGGCANTGQTCAGVERVYVVEDVYAAFVDALARLAGSLRVGGDPRADIGAITMPGQVEVIRAHVRDALERGATAVVGGLDAIRPPFVDPIVLVGVPEDARVMREETFGPVLPVVGVRDADEAVAKANDSEYGLGATVYGRAAAAEVASRLDVGMVSINSVLTYAAIPGLPFGGRGESGFGRVHGEDGLKEFVTPRALTHERVRLPFQPTSFQRPRALLPALLRLSRLRHGRAR